MQWEQMWRILCGRISGNKNSLNLASDILSIQFFPLFHQLPFFVSGWCRARQSWRCMLRRRPCRNPPEQKQELMQGRWSQPPTPMRKRPKRLQLYETGTFLRWRRADDTNVVMDSFVAKKKKKKIKNKSVEFVVQGQIHKQLQSVSTLRYPVIYRRRVHSPRPIWRE